MNLSEIASIIGQRTGLVQDRDIATCKSFLTMRHDQLWRSFLWKDSLCEWVVPIDPNGGYTTNSSFLPTKGILILPPTIAQVIAARTDKGKLNVERPMLYYRVDQDQFIKTGNPTDFMTLSSVLWDFDTAQNLNIQYSNAGDAGVSLTYSIIGADNVSVSKTTVALAAGLTTGSIESLVSAIKPVTQGTVSFVDSNSNVIVTLGANDVTLPKSQRVQFLYKPDVSYEIRVLGKQTTPSFTLDTDYPAVNGMDGVLMELVCYDMLLRDERGGTQESRDCLEYANTLKKMLIEEETVQAAYNSRIMPESGFGGDEYFGASWNMKSSPY